MESLLLADLMKKINALFDGDLVLKYQVPPEDLDALVSVRSDEDVRHMLDEYQRQESRGIHKFRTFLFPSNPLVTENIPFSSIDHPALTEQRYIDAINGIASSIANLKLPRINANRSSFSISAASSPKSNSPDGNVIDSELASINACQNKSRLHMHKVQSSPSLCSLNNIPHQSSSNNNMISNQHYHHHPQHHHHHQNLQHHHPHPHQPFRQPQDSYRGGGGNERLATALSLGRQDLSNSGGPTGHGINQYYMTSRRPNIYYDEYCSIYGCRRTNRGDSLPQSPRGNNWE